MLIGTYRPVPRSIVRGHSVEQAVEQELLVHAVSASCRVVLARQPPGIIGAGAKLSGKPSERAVELARHFEQGRDYERAVRYRRLAAENALDRWAYYEAISHLIRGVEILNRLPDTPERARQELDFQASLGLALMLTKGFAASEVGTVNVRAAELCQQIGEPVQLFPLLWQLRQHHIVRGETQTAYELAERLLSLAEAM